MTPDVETEVPAEDSPERCPYCDRPFADETLRSLHEGIAHYEVLAEAGRTTFAERYESEEESIRRFRLKALVVLVALYFGFLWTYSLVG